MRDWITPDIHAVFFDAVGTILFPSPAAPAVYAAVAREHGLDLSAEQIHNRFIRAFRQEEERDRAAAWATSEARELARWRHIVFDTLCGVADPEACFRRLYDHFARPDAWRVHPNVVALFPRLVERGLKLGLASNYDCRLLSVVKGLPELAPLRECIAVSSRIGWRKPAAAFFEEVVRLAGCARSQILLVGDDLENDYEGARAAGLQAVLLDESGRHGNIERHIRTLNELSD